MFSRGTHVNHPHNDGERAGRPDRRRGKRGRESLGRSRPAHTSAPTDVGATVLTGTRHVPLLPNWLGLLCRHWQLPLTVKAMNLMSLFNKGPSLVQPCRQRLKQAGTTKLGGEEVSRHCLVSPNNRCSQSVITQPEEHCHISFVNTGNYRHRGAGPKTKEGVGARRKWGGGWVDGSLS